MTVANYIMVGGFLGAGKTTAILKLAEMFRERGQRVGLITNDQSVGLVDTAMLDAHDFPVEEITGGCFCCRFNSLTEAANKLNERERPEVFLAEPVGSCTDLTATVSYPLRRLYGDQFQIAPFSVLVDPIRAERILGLASGKSFSPKVVYIYLKQLEEADMIVVNKIDLLPAERLELLVAKLKDQFPDAKVMTASARDGTGLSEWFDAITQGHAGTGPSMEIDYYTYAEGEALLGWVNLTAQVKAPAFNGNAYLSGVLTELHGRLAETGTEVAHLKMTLSPDQGSDLGVINLVRNDGTGELSHTLQDPLNAGELILNLRAEGDPETLKATAIASIEAVSRRYGVQATVAHVEAFRPGRPVPTHRDLRG
jgi:Ni2+-binding GTPase involved in maturation of urease and hydrogenase